MTTPLQSGAHNIVSLKKKQPFSKMEVQPPLKQFKRRHHRKPKIVFLILALILSAQFGFTQCDLDAQCARDNDVSCVGASDGQVSVTIVGGTAPISLVWSANAGSATTPVVSGLPAGVYTVTATDVNGCIDICAAQVNIGTDFDPPSVMCADFIASFDDCPAGLGPNTPNGVWFPIGPTGGFTAASGGSYSMFLDLSTCVSDNCSALADIEVTLFSSYTESSTACAITLVNEFSVRDEEGNVSPDNIITRFTIEDMSGTPPTITCPVDVTLECDESTVPLIDGGLLPNPIVTDDCDPAPMVAYSDTFTPGSCNQNRVIERTWTAINACGVTSSCIQTITVQDTEGPVVTCADFTATYDGCPGPLGPNTPNGTWIAVGPDGGFTAASGGSFSIPVDLTSCVADNCGLLENLEYTLHSSYEENRTSCAVTLVNEFSIRDECGNVAADRVITKITIQDDEAPDVTCTEFSETFNRCPDPLGPNTPSGNWLPVPASGTFLTAVGGSSIGTIDLNGCVTDNCGDFASGGLEYMISDSYEENRVPGCSVDIINEFMIRDICGNVSPVKFNFRGMIRFDGAPPVIVCPADVGVNCGDSTDPADTGMATATSECGTPAVTFVDAVAPGACPEEMVITRTWTATDGCGKTSECDQIITVECPLMIDCSNIFDQTLSCRADLPPVDFDLPIIIQSCGDVTKSALTIIPGNSGCPGDEVTITRTYFLQDQAGNMENCMQTFTVVSNVLPTIVCPAGMVVECASDIMVDAADAIATAECGTPMVAVTGPVVVGDPDCPSTTYTYTYTVTDACNRTASCDQVFTIENDLPTITCPADMTAECFADIIVDPSDATVVTSCVLGFNTVITGPVQMGPSDCPGTTYTYTYTTTDVCGRTASCQQIFTIQNNGPILTCPAPVTVECAADIVVDPTDVGVVTSCGLTYTAQVFGPNVYDGTPDCPGARYVYRYLVEDECGRIAICEREFIIDNAAPTVTCIGNQIVECEDDIILDPEQVITIVTSCDLEADIDIDGPNFVGGVPTCSGAQYSVTYTVTDPCGRSDQCTITWTLANSGPMIVTCAPDRVVECQDDIASEPDLLEVELACGTYQVFPSNIYPISGMGNCPGDQWGIDYEVIDVCGRSASCTQVWTIENEAPRVIPPDPITVACLDDVNPSIFDAEVETSCGLPVVDSEIFGPFYDEDKPLCAGSVVNYLYSFYDACGRMTCQGQTVTIHPGANGMFEDMTVDCDEIPAALTTTEACGITYDLEVSEKEIDDPGTSNSNYKLIRTYTSVDACGNIFEIEQTIRVKCDDPQNSSRSYCGLTDRGWLEMFSYPEDPIFENIDISKNNPLLIGEVGRAFIVDDFACLEKLFSNEGIPMSFFPGMGDVKMSIEDDCNFNYPDKIGAYTIENSLLSHLVSFALNIQVDPKLAGVNLNDICQEIDKEVLEQLRENPTVQGLYDMGESALLGYYNGDIYQLDKTLINVLDYFEACPTLPCSGGRFTEGFSDRDPTGMFISRLEVFPNPAIANINYMVKSVQEEVTVRIYSALGNLIYEKTWQDTARENISLDALPSGVYQMVLFENDRVIETQKFIKQAE